MEEEVEHQAQGEGVEHLAQGKGLVVEGVRWETLASWSPALVNEEGSKG